MSRQHHHIKCETKQFQAVEAGRKKFEFRKNDRDYREYDIVYLHESVNSVETGRVIACLEITYILYGGQFGIPEGYCIFNWGD